MIFVPKGRSSILQETGGLWIFQSASGFYGSALWYRLHPQELFRFYCSSERNEDMTSL